LTAFDYGLLFLLTCSVLISTMRGLVKEILSLLGWIASFMVANAYGEELALLLPNSLPGNTVRLIVAFIALFIGVMLAMKLLSGAVESMVAAAGLTVVDRGLGGLFGLGRGMVFALALVLLCGMTSIPQQAFWKNALFSPMAVTAARTALPFLPGSFAHHVRY